VRLAAVAVPDRLDGDGTDDGRGGATLVGPGSGLRGLIDRVESRGGRLELASGSSGTTVNVTVPAEGPEP
jgi:signal transduction histidine kinase